MKPLIDGTRFGSITIEGEVYNHDVVIDLNGRIRKRRKKLSKDVYGTSHTVSAAEARDVYQAGARLMLVGTGQTGFVTLSAPAADFLREKGCDAELLPTGKALEYWNRCKVPAVALLHVTC